MRQRATRGLCNEEGQNVAGRHAFATRSSELTLFTCFYIAIAVWCKVR